MAEEHHDFITLKHGMFGYYAVWMWWNPQYGGFWEPWDTSVLRHTEREYAEADAKAWAEGVGLKYLDTYPTNPKV